MFERGRAAVSSCGVTNEVSLHESSPLNLKENNQADAIKLALIPAFSPEEKGNRRQAVGNVARWNQVQGFNARIFRGILTPRGRICTGLGEKRT